MQEKHQEGPAPEASTSESALPPDHNPSPIPDGGREAWLVLVGSMVTLFHTWGVINSFGVFQTYYTTTLLRNESASAISWIGSLQAALLMMGGLFSGPLYDAGHLRALLVAGNALVVAGMLLTSACTRYWQLVLAQGVCVGLGCAAMFLPSTAVLSQWFARRRALAFGLQSAGAPLAGIVLPALFGRLQPRIGFAWATRVLAFVLLALAVVPLVCIKMRHPLPRTKTSTTTDSTATAPTAHRRAFLDMTVFSDRPFLTYAVAGFCGFIGLYVPFFYVELYSLEYGLATSDFSPYLVTLLNAGSVVGRIVPNYVADHLGPIPVFIAVMLASSVFAFSWIAITNLPGLIVFCVLYGMTSGGVVSTNVSAIVPYCPDMSRLGTRMGMCTFFAGFSALTGTPIGGAILGQGGAVHWRNIRVYSGTALLVSGLLLSVSLVLHQRQRRKPANF